MPERDRWKTDLGGHLPTKRNGPARVRASERLVGGGRTIDPLPFKIAAMHLSLPYPLLLSRRSARSLSEIRLICCGCAGFGQIFRSFSFNRPHYSPQTIETSDSNQYTLVTIANLGQAPRFSMASGQLEVRIRGHSCFTSAAPLCKPDETLSTSPPRGFSAACHGMICQAPRVEFPCI